MIIPHDLSVNFRSIINWLFRYLNEIIGLTFSHLCQGCSVKNSWCASCILYFNNPRIQYRSWIIPTRILKIRVSACPWGIKRKCLSDTQKSFENNDYLVLFCTIFRQGCRTAWLPWNCKWFLIQCPPIFKKTKKISASISLCS